MIFNPDPSKQAHEIVFSHKANASNHETVYFNNVPAIRENIQKHLGLFFDSKLSFFDHIKEKIKKATKWVNVIRKITCCCYAILCRQYINNFSDLISTTAL